MITQIWFTTTEPPFQGLFIGIIHHFNSCSAQHRETLFCFSSLHGRVAVRAALHTGVFLSCFKFHSQSDLGFQRLFFSLSSSAFAADFYGCSPCVCVCYVSARSHSLCAAKAALRCTECSSCHCLADYPDSNWSRECDASTLCFTQ